MITRIPILRFDTDGSVREGTARLSTEQPGKSKATIDDFRDIHHEPMGLPPGSSFRIGFTIEKPEAIRWENPE